MVDGRKWCVLGTRLLTSKSDLIAVGSRAIEMLGLLRSHSHTTFLSRLDTDSFIVGESGVLFPPIVSAFSNPTKHSISIAQCSGEVGTGALC